MSELIEIQSQNTGSENKESNESTIDLNLLKEKQNEQNQNDSNKKKITEEEYEQVPFFPKQNIPDDIIASFKPSPQRNTNVGNFAPIEQSNPRKHFDNHPSNIAWDETGRFHSKKELSILINGNTLPDSPFGKIFGTLATIFTGGLWLIFKKRSVPEGRFIIVKKSIHHEIRLAGHYTLPSTTANWGELKLYDDENTNVVQVGNKSIVQIPANHLGMAYLVGNKRIIDEDGSIRIVKDKDVVLFSQGSYVLTESRFRGIKLIKIDPKKKIIHEDHLPVTILQVGANEIGIARKKSTQKYHIFQTGAPLLFDNKEWFEFDVVKRTSETFVLGPFTYLTLTGREIASITNKNGKSLFLSQKGTYIFHEKQWNAKNKIIKMMNANNVDVGEYYVRTVDKNQVGTCRNLNNGKFYTLETGKYILEKRIWGEIDIQRIDRPLVKCGPFWFVRVQKDYFVGAMNVRTGEFIELTEVGKLHCLHVKDFPHIERVLKVNYKPTKFGFYTLITVKDGLFGVFEEQGKIRIETAGTYKLQPGTKVLQSLPTRPQFVSRKFKFITSDRFELTGSCSIQFEMKDPKLFAQELRSRGEYDSLVSYSSVTEELISRCIDSLKKRLREHKLIDLSPLGQKTEEILQEKKPIETIIYEQCQEALSEMTDFCKSTKIGILFTKVEVIGGLVLVDRTVREKFSKLAQLELDYKVQKKDGEVRKAREKIETELKKEKSLRDRVINITVTETNNQILMKKKEVGLEIKRKELENEKLLQKTKLELEIKKQENEVKKKNLVLQQKINEIKSTADAENYRDNLKHKLIKSRPNILNELEKMQKMVNFGEVYGKSAWRDPKMMNLLQKKVNFQFGDFLMFKEIMNNNQKQSSL